MVVLVRNNDDKTVWDKAASYFLLSDFWNHGMLNVCFFADFVHGQKIRFIFYPGFQDND
jgi:hypothetical protein